MFGIGRIGLGIALACVAGVLLLAVAVVSGKFDSGSEPGSLSTLPGGRRVSFGVSHAVSSGDWHPVYNEEALPCTGPKQPVNFETYSAGPSVAGLRSGRTERRCDGGPPAERANYVSYIYGECKIVKGATGCQPPLEVQTWPACQRFLAKYSFKGKPLPHRRLSKRGGAAVVEFDFALDNRIEVYTKSSTIVIFATNRGLAMKAVALLRPLEEGKPPAADAAALVGEPSEELAPPTNGSMEGALPCHS